MSSEPIHTIEPQPGNRARTLAGVVFAAAIATGPVVSGLTLSRWCSELPAWTVDVALEGTWTGEAEQVFTETSPIATGFREQFNDLRARFGLLDSELATSAPGGWMFLRHDFDEAHRERYDAARSHRIERLVQYRTRARAAGVDLVVLPVPDKSIVYPEIAEPRAFHAAQYAAMLEELASAGLSAVDLLAEFRRLRADEPTAQVYFRGDTHWTNRGCITAALAVGSSIEPRRDGTFEAWTMEFTATKDLVESLALPPTSPMRRDLLDRDRHLNLSRVDDRDAIRPVETEDPSAAVILCGDSFGEGLIHPLAGALGRTLDARFVRAGEGMFSGLLAALDAIEARDAAARTIVWTFVQRSYAAPWAR